MRQVRPWILLLCMLLPATAWAASSEVVELRYRNAGEMAAVVQPHLEPGESVSGLDNKLILRLKPENRDSILALIRQLDKRPQQLLVSVRQGGESQGNRSELGVSGRYRTGKGSVQLGDDAGPVSGRVVQHHTSGRDGAEQQIRVMDGQEASFQVGQLVPVPGNTTFTPQGYVLIDGLYYQAVTTGFVVRPRASGERVLLEIRPHRDQLQSDGTIAVQSVQTTIEARAGEWIDIGWVVEDFARQQQGLTSYGHSEGSHRSRVEVKVELEK